MSEALAKDVANLIEQCLKKDKEIERLYSIAKELKEYIEFLKQTDEVILEEGINKIIEEINEMLGSDKND